MSMSEELQQLTETANSFLKEHAGGKAFRVMRQADPDAGFDVALWQKMVELGWAGMSVPEALGGYDMGPTAAVLVAESLGANLASTPFAQVVFAARALTKGAGVAAKPAEADRLTGLAEGRRLFAVAIDETPRHRGLAGIETTATPDGTGFKLNGTKRNVLDVPAVADLLVVAHVARLGPDVVLPSRSPPAA